jgi:hypothetical protein
MSSSSSSSSAAHADFDGLEDLISVVRHAKRLNRRYVISPPGVGDPLAYCLECVHNPEVSLLASSPVALASELLRFRRRLHDFVCSSNDPALLVAGGSRHKLLMSAAPLRANDVDTLSVLAAFLDVRLTVVNLPESMVVQAGSRTERCVVIERMGHGHRSQHRMVLFGSGGSGTASPPSLAWTSPDTVDIYLAAAVHHRRGRMPRNVECAGSLYAEEEHDDGAPTTK